MARLKRTPEPKANKEVRQPEFIQDESSVLRFWDTQHIFAKTLEKTKDGKPFVFYEGPPTANGKPGIHHVLARAFKDVIVRFQTMNGRYVERKAGWDTHGLPVEITVEKELGISGKKDIENIVASDKRASIAGFNARCKENVMSLITDWEQLTRRIGYWLDFENDYRTYRNDYMETLWWIIKKMSEITTDAGPLLYKGHKVVPHCPRCETALSSHEVAQGYKNVQDTSVYVKFRITKTNLLKAQSLIEDGKDVSILSWTTTPWTLPGNVALAIDPKLTYVLVKHEDEYLILAQARCEEVIGEGTKTELEFRGEDLLQTRYEPLFAGAIDGSGYPNAWTVLPAAFVTADDGTGVVHTAVMYGEDDYQLGLEQKLPTQHTVTPEGRFTDAVSVLKNKFVKDPETEKSILDFLHEHKRVFRVEPFTHEYPFCWRCGTPLLYYAKDSWYVRMSALREVLQKNNTRINWQPEHIKEGRFGEWLNEAKDWAFSRERYWGTPLPIWECQECGKTETMGSFDELRKRADKKTLPKATRTIHLMRHGLAESNVSNSIYSVFEKDAITLTSGGKKCVEVTAKKLKGKIDLIISSDFIRTRETAEIVAKATGADVRFDRRLREYYIPSFEGKKTDELRKQYPENWRRIHNAPEGGETLLAVARRMREAIIDSVQQFSEKRILFISHGDSLWSFLWQESGKKETDLDSVPYPELGKSQELNLKNIPLNPHRPFVDDIEMRCSCKKSSRMKRVEEVADVWFDSGSMPFAQYHYPFESQKEIASGMRYPADYISEAIDQTRGWFYTLLAVATVLDKEAPYKNVISLGHILDENGEKMSKSKGNIVDPWDVINDTGADALRFHFYSMNQPGDVKIFNLDAVRDVVRKTFMIAWNVQSFYVLYGGKSVVTKPPAVSHAMDVWLLSLLETIRADVTEHLQHFRIFDASRAVRDFVQELSTWYVRRSRTRIKENESGARDTLGYSLWVMAHLFAPFAPLFAEQLFMRIKGNMKLESIHLSDWPQQIMKPDLLLLKNMKVARQSVELFHSIRKEQSLKSRQPLAAARINRELSDAVKEILREEINVDAIETQQDIKEQGAWKTKEVKDLCVALNCEITASLKERGGVRELIRHINDLRKLARLTPDDTIDLYVATKETARILIEKNKKEILQSTKTNSIVFEMPEDIEASKNVSLDGSPLILALRRLP